MNLKQFYDLPTVVDASILFDFYELGALKLLNLVFSDLYIPYEMMAEIANDTQLIEIKKQLKYGEIVLETRKGLELFARLSKTKKQLSVYDRHLLCTAYEKGFQCASNDGTVTKVCKELGVKNPCTLGILGCANTVGLISLKELEQFVCMLVSEKCSSRLTRDDQTVTTFTKIFKIELG